MPYFSIIIPAYNSADYLSQCVASIQKQSFEDWEAVIVVDGSPDDSLLVAESLSKEDPRVRVVAKNENEGIHRARLTGIAHAAGEFIFFLDADDELHHEALAKLSSCNIDEETDIVHLGINVIGVNIDECERATFEAYINKDFSPLIGEEICAYAYSSDIGFLQDWRFTQRLYRSSLLKRAASLMTDERLGRNEDGYEFFVVSCLASKQITRNDIVALDYYYGRGLNSSARLSVDKFYTACLEFDECLSAIESFSDSFTEFETGPYASGARQKAIELLMNDWKQRVSECDKEETAIKAADIFGGLAMGAQLMRISRDDAYALWINEKVIDERALCVKWFKLGERLAAGDLVHKNKTETDYYNQLRAEACGHLHNLECRSSWAIGESSTSPSLVKRSSYESQSIRIFVTTHKDVDLFSSDILQPVQVSGRTPRRRLLWAFQDDEGQSVSGKNAMYCELTTQYWAWKNVNADYYGFCHYRRYFDFSEETHEENPYGEIIDQSIDWDSQARYCLDDDSIRKCVTGYDVITTGIKDLRAFPEKYRDPYDHYARAPYLHIADLDRVVDILKFRHPDYADDADSYLAGHSTCFCNMYIMRKELYYRYCEWLFPILDEFVAGWDVSKLSHESLRTPGHLSERLFNIWLLHEKRANPSLKHKEVQCVHFEHPEHYVTPCLKSVDGGGRQVVPVVFAADENYVPMVTTTAYSMLENASSEFYYDIIVLEKDFSERSKRLMFDFFSRYPNVQIRFANVSGMIKAYNLQTSNAHISVETYYRFLIQKVLPEYDQVLYLDSDLIVEGDVSELFGIQLGENLLAAARDIDYLGNLNMIDGERMHYSDSVLRLDDPYGYFQAGVLVLNTAQMRGLYPFEKWLEIASEPKYIYDDQDILNAHAQGRVLYLDNAWNVMNDCGGRISKVFSFAPADVYDAYMVAHASPKIIHYAGFEKPWKPGSCDMAEYYWKYARNTPFYETLLAMKFADKSQLDNRVIDLRDEMNCYIQCTRDELENDIQRSCDAAICRLTTPARAISEDSSLRKIFDGVLPQGSKRREAAKRLVRTLRGR